MNGLTKPEVAYILVATIFVVWQGLFWHKWHGGGWNSRSEYVRQALLNTLGSFLGWSAGYFLVFYKFGHGFSEYKSDISDLVIFLIAFYGIVGQLPHVMINKLNLGKH